MKELSLSSRDDFEQVLELYNKMVYRLAFARTGNVQDAEDVLQEVFLRYIRADKTFNDEEHRKAWLLRVTVNCSKTLVTSAWNKRRSGEETDDNFFGTDDKQLERLDTKSAVLEAVKSLPEKYRVVVHLFYYEELSVEEIGQITGSGLSAVKTRLHRARNMLKNILKEEELYE